MSLGSDFGSGTDSRDSLAADAAVKAGVVVVSAAGNAGNIPLCIGLAGRKRQRNSSRRQCQGRLLTVQPNFSLPAVTGAAATAITALNANNASWPSPESLQLVVLSYLAAV